ncbi:methyltransferase [Anaerocolumna sedimenticola]|uniref:Methyltransferase n=1 Tax=Anaerocolumna sedimenticola TaxID=2696063 RepID=A0A6P1TKN3_9FIRM|nr:methyltransferase domain-containing protein [Anaerocolumna sedimenticola]QHQ59848.1 methyltransferase [Anaerocolumna sedimenticola]
MIRDTFEKLKQKADIRQNLIQLRSELKEGHNKTALLYQIGTDYDIFEDFLKHEDAKVRKNTALIMGELGIPAFLDKLIEAYRSETQLFVRSSYLTALKGFNYQKLIPELKEKLSVLSVMNQDETNKKHINEEIRTLSELIISAEGIKQHIFTGFQVPSRLVLLTNRNFIKITMDQIKDEGAKEFNAGVIVKTKDINTILPIRTYSELLFMQDDLKTCSSDISKAAESIAKSKLLEFMKARHEGGAPYYFRIELKSKADLDKKSAFAKKLGVEIERLTGRQLINSTSNYEFEIRLIENKEGNYNILLKLYTLKDERFSYRKNAIATSIQPVNAALIAALAKDYLMEGAQILDPFCGVGTMLIERHKLVRANTIYGLDIYSNAIEKAKENAKAAHAIIHYINRDFFDFKHEYLFDEIFTDMPRIMGHKEEREIFELYRRFFQKAKVQLKKNGIMVLYSHNPEYMKKLLNPREYRLEQEYEISKKEKAYLYIIRSI